MIGNAGRCAWLPIRFTELPPRTAPDAGGVPKTPSGTNCLYINRRRRCTGATSLGRFSPIERVRTTRRRRRLLEPNWLQNFVFQKKKQQTMFRLRITLHQGFPQTPDFPIASSHTHRPCMTPSTSCTVQTSRKCTRTATRDMICKKKTVCCTQIGHWDHD